MTPDSQPSRFRRLLRNIRGSTAIEYAIIAAGIASALVVAIAATNGSLTALWTSIKNALG